MKSVISLCICCFAVLFLNAQITTKPIKDTSVKIPKIVLLKNQKKYYNTTLIKNEIDSLLTIVILKHTKEINSEAVWVQIRKEATDVLMSYYTTGKLMGTKPEQAFFVKMGNETMTATDIINHKMILLYGIAISKPAEFITGTIVALTTQSLFYL